MKLLTLILALLLTAAAPQHSAFAARADNAEIDRYVAQQVRDARLPGLSFAIVRDGALVHSGSYGSAADGQPLTAQTPFGIGSMTKSFTALAAMQLAEAGEIELDAPVQRYLPWFRVADPAASAQITVRHLLNQTSGLSQHDGFWDAAASGDPLEQRVRALADVRLGSAPGSEFAYSNSNFDVVGMVIQQVSGQQYAAYVAEHILQPLEMANSSFAPAVRAPGHQDWYGLALPARPGVGQAMLPAGGLYSSAEDMGRYLIDQLAAGRAGNGLLSPAGYAELHRASGVGGSRYAMGWVARTNQNPPMVEHGGASPAYHSQMLFAPQQGLGVVVLSNVNTVPFGSIPAERIAEGTLALLVGGTPQAAGFAGASTPLLFKWGLLALTAWGIITLPSALRRRNRLLAERGVRLGDAAAVAGNGAVGLFLLFVLPDVVGTPLWAMLRFSPDVALLLIAGALSSLLTGALILLLMLRAKAGQGTPATLPAEAA